MISHDVFSLLQQAYDFQSIDNFINEQQQYLNPSLSINQLAKALNVSAREISRLVNIYAKRNFSDYINCFRVRHACREIESSSNDNRKLLDILLCSGFNSKSSFNAVFKKEMKMTPSQYRSANKT